MVGSTALASYSNACIYSAMLVLAAALVAFAVSFAAGRRPSTASVVAAADRVPAMAGGPSAVDSDPAAAGRRTPDSLDPGRRAGNVGLALTWLAFGLLVAGVTLRGLWAGRVPWGNMYEFSLASGVGILAVYLVMSTRRDLRWLGLFVVAATLLTLGVAVTLLYTEAAQLVPALKSYWLAIHVSAAVICGGAFTVAAGLTVLYLIRDRAERRDRVGPLLARVPDSATLDRLAYRILAFSFILWTFAVVSGAIWAENAWGRYWGWDPKETWAFITWVIYAGYLHARATAGWKGRRAAYISLLGFAAFLINYFGVNLFVSGLHSYSGL